MSVALFSAEPMKEAILRASSERNARTRSLQIMADLLVFFSNGAFLVAKAYCQAADCTNGFFTRPEE